MRAKALIVGALLGAAAAAAAPGVASAATVYDAYDAYMDQDPVSLGSFNVKANVAGVSELNLSVKSFGKWWAQETTHLIWDTNRLRAGGTLPVSRSVPMTRGNATVGWTVTGTVKVIGQGTKSIDAKTFYGFGTCLPNSLGSAYDCDIESMAGGLSLYKTEGVPGSPYVKLGLTARFTVTPEGTIVNRSLSVLSTSTSTANGLSLGLLPAVDNVPVPCNYVGANASYALRGWNWSPSVAVSQQPKLAIGFMDPIAGLVEFPFTYNEKVGSPHKSTATFGLTGAKHVTGLGQILPNNVAPTLASIGTVSGKAGTPIQFSADADGRCGLDYEWKFSDGKLAYGESPQRTFAQPGTYTGKVTVTDGTGLDAARNFTVNVY